MIRRNSAALALSLLITSSVFAQTDPPTATPPADAVRTSNGLAFLVVTPATGTAAPTMGDFVRLKYTGWSDDGVAFDSTDKHPDVNIFPFDQLAPGMKEAIGAMKAGEARRVWIPATLWPKKVPVAFDIELIDISQPMTPPADVAEPPADAERSPSGLAWKVLKPGSGTEHPKRSSFVTVRYSGWKTDGAMFDSTFLRGDPASFRLDAVIPGWREGLQLMLPGEIRRFWIPERHAYRGQRNMPQGMLVFDIELLRFR